MKLDKKLQAKVCYLFGVAVGALVTHGDMDGKFIGLDLLDQFDEDEFMMVDDMAELYKKERDNG